MDMLIDLPFEIILDYRTRTFRLLPGQQLKTREDAVDYVNQRGFVYFWPIQGIHMPSLWTAVAGDRPVADAHDDPGHVTWGWKDALLGGQSWYYAKVLRKKATMISMEAVPYFYALSSNYGSPEDDYLTQYEQGQLTQEAKSVYEAILEHGPLDTIALKKAARLSSRENQSRFNKAVSDLQADFKLVPVEVTQAGAWRYAFAYDITARHYPGIVQRARFIGERQARRHLAEIYFLSLGAAQPQDLTRLFGWRPAETRATLDELIQGGRLRADLEFKGQKGQWLALSDLILPTH